MAIMWVRPRRRLLDHERRFIKEILLPLIVVIVASGVFVYIVEFL